MENGFIKIAAVTPKLLIGNPKYNLGEIKKLLKNIDSQIAVFPELSVTSYSCSDLFYYDELIKDAEEEVRAFLLDNEYDGVVILGAPVKANNKLYNCAVVIQNDKILGIVPKTYLPNKGEFCEKRWFNTEYNFDTVFYANNTVPFGKLIFSEETYNIKFGIEICYDMFAPITPGNIYSINGANMIINISASNEVLGKGYKRKNTIIENSKRNCGAYIYCSTGIFESTSDTVFSGNNIIASNGNLIAESSLFNLDSNVLYGIIDIDRINYERIQSDCLNDALYYEDIEIVDFFLPKKDNTPLLDQTPFVPKKNIIEDFNIISSIQETALYRRILHVGVKSIVIGVSGGLDSTLTLLVAHQAFKKLGYDTKGIIAVTMPGLATSKRTKNNAMELMKNLNVTIKEIDIKNAILDHFLLIEHDKNVQDITYENAQARMRTLILMDLANKYNGIVIGTGDMSEIALGWCTYNGDQMSMYNVNGGLPKTLVRFMVEEYANNKYNEIKDVLMDIVNTPISPELKENQKTEESVGKYEINDFILYQFLVCGSNKEKICVLLNKAFNIDGKDYVDNFFNRFYSQQYKRQASPDCPRVLSISLDAKGGFRMASEVKR